MKNSLTNENDYLNALFKTAQYLATLITYQDFWVYIKELIKEFYNVDFFYFYECGYDGKIFKLQKNFSNNQFSEKIFEQIKELLAQVMDSGFIASELINIPESYAIVLLPITKIKKIMGIMVIGHQRNELLPKYLVNIYLSLARLLSTTIDNLYMIEELKIHHKKLKKSETKFREQNEFLMNVIESLTHPFYIINASDYKITMANSAARLSSLTKATTCYALTHKCNEPCKGEHPCPLEIVKKTKMPAFVEHIHYDEEGYVKNVEVHCHPIFDEKGEVVQVIEYSFDITERKEAEQALKESEEKFRLLAENIPGIIYLCRNDESYAMLYANDEMENITGYPKEEFLEERLAFTEIIRPDYIESIAADIEEALEKRESYHLVYPIKNKSGELRWLDEVGVGVYKDEQLLWLEGFVTDITKSKIAEQQLKASEEKYRLITENANDMIAVLNNQFEYQYVNELVHMKVLGYSNDEFLGKTPLDFIHPDDKEKAIKALQDCLEYGECIEVVRFLKKNDTPIWLENKAKLFLNEIGVKSIICISRDITERKKAEQVIADLAKFPSENPNPVLRANKEKVMYINQAGKILFKNERGIKIPEALRNIVNKAFIDNSNKILEATLENRVFSFNISPIENENYANIYGMDITEKKKAEEIIKNEIEKLRELDKIRNELILRLPHELNTPLHLIYTTSQYILNTYKNNIDFKILRLIENIFEGGKRLKKMIDTLLNISKFESKDFKIEKQNINICDIIKKSVEEVQYLALNRNHRIETDIPLNLYLKGDYSKLMEVVINILTNAIKNTPPGGRIFLKTSEKADFVDIIIKDMGVGITKNEKQMLFKKFGKIERFNENLDIITEGSGIGLYLVKQIIDLHDGQIQVKSKGRNKGSTFTIRLGKS